VYGGSDNKIYFFNRKGKLLWSYEAGAPLTSVSVSSIGAFIVAAAGDKIYLFTKDGELLWSHEIAGGGVKDVSVSSDGSFIAVSDGSKIYLFDKNAKLLWSYEIGDVVTSISISSDGSYIAASSLNTHKIYFFNNKSELLWSRYLSEISPGYPGVSSGDLAISSDSSYILAGTNLGDIYLFNKEGKPLWGIYMGFGNSKVSISSDGDIVAAIWNMVYFFASSPEKHAMPINESASAETAIDSINNLHIYASAAGFLAALILASKGVKLYLAKRRKMN